MVVKPLLVVLSVGALWSVARLVADKAIVPSYHCLKSPCGGGAICGGGAV